MATSTRPDGRTDALTLLGGPAAADVLAAALAPEGGELVRWRASQIVSRRRGTVAAYRATVRWPDGRTTDEVLGACTGDLPAGTLVLDDGHQRVAVWALARDPDLPGLGRATNPAAVAALLAGFGGGAGPVGLTVRAYRPRRRAVVEAAGAGGRLFVKAVRPAHAEALHERHRTLVAHRVPAPQSLGWTDDGLVVLAPLTGPTLREAIRLGAVLPPAAAVLELLDRLPAALADGPARPSWLDRVGHYAEATAAVAPAAAARVRAVAAAVAAEAGTGPVVPTHGDLYEAQLVVDGPRITGLLDVDGAGPGDRLDDLGCLLGHLSVLARVDPAHAPAITALGRTYLRDFERTVDPADLRYRAAAVVVSLTTGPHRVQQADWPAATLGLVGLAEQWLRSARQSRGGPGRARP